jgi:hypothetical protein
MGFIINFLSGKLLDSLFSSKRKWAFIVVIAGALVVSGMVYTGYRHVVNLQAERDQLLADNTMLTANNSQLEQARISITTRDVGTISGSQSTSN